MVALGVLERLDKPLYGISAGPATGPTTQALALPPKEDSEQGGTSSTVSSTTSEPEPIEYVCSPPRVVAADSTTAEFAWSPPTCAKPLPVAASSEFVLELNLAGPAVEATAEPSAWQCYYRGQDLRAKVTQLLAGRRYLCRLRVHVDLATDTEGDEEGSCSREYAVQVHDAQPVAFSTAPSLPTALQPPALVQRARNALKLKWNSPEDPGGEFELTYVLQISPAPTGMENKRAYMGFVEVYRGPERSYKVMKLNPGMRYTSRVQAINPLGEGPFSLCSAFTTQATVPAAPQPPSCTTAAATSLALQWAAPPDNGSPIVAYVLEKDDCHGSGFQLAYAGPNLHTVIKGLKPGLEYQFRLRADNDEGKSLWSSTATFRTGASPPDSPMALQVVASNRTSATLAWRPPDDDGGSRVVAFEVELQAKSKAATAAMGSEWLKIFDGEAHACTINSLRPGCAYRARVRARNTAGWGQWALPVDLTTAADAPESPLMLSVASCASHSLILTWLPPRHDCGAKVHMYRMEMAPAQCMCGACPCVHHPGVPPQQPCPAHALHPVYAGDACGAEVHHLQPGTSYLFRVQAVNAHGAGPWTDWLYVRTGAAAPMQPAPPMLVSASASSVQVAWEAPLAQGAPVTCYVLEAMQLPAHTGMPHAHLQQQQHGQVCLHDAVAGLSPAAAACGSAAAAVYRQVYRGPQQSCEVRGLEPHTPYALRVCAANDVGASPWSEPLTALTAHAAPTAPEHLSASGCSPAEVQLSWAPPAHDYGSPVTFYVAEVSAVGRGGGGKGGAGGALGGWQHAYTGPALACKVSGLAPGRAYQFRVRAANGCGFGPFCPLAQATTLPAPPSAPGKPSTSQRTAAGFKVRWDEPMHANGAAVSAYTLEACAAGSEQWQAVYTGPDTSARLACLQPATKYSLRVCAANAAGPGPYSEAESAATMLLPPTAPAAPTVSGPELASGLDTACAMVTWAEPPASTTTSAAVSYEVLATPKALSVDGTLGPAPPAWATVKITVAKRCEARLEGLMAGITYSLKLRAVGAEGSGHSAWSEELLFTTPAGVRRGVAAGVSRDPDLASVCSDAQSTTAAGASVALVPASGQQHSQRRGGRGKAAKRAAAAAAAAASAGTSSTDNDDAAPPVRSSSGMLKAAGERQRVAAAATVVAAKKRPVQRPLFERVMIAALGRNYKAYLMWLLALFVVVLAVFAMRDLLRR